MTKTVKMDSSLFSLLAEKSVSSVVMTDSQGSIVYVNNAFLEITGYTKDEILGMNSRILSSPKTSHDTYREIFATVSSGKIWRGELTSTRKNGEYFFVKASIFGSINADGVLENIIYSTSDISEQKKVEERLLAGLDTFHRLFYVSPDSININQYPSGEFVMVNSGFIKNMGFMEDEVIGRSPSDLDIWKDLSERDTLMGLLSSDGSVSNFRALFRTKNGSVRTALVSSTLVDIGGKVHTINITRDITEIEITEEKLATTFEKLAKTLKGTVQVISKVVEMRDPYTANHQNNVMLLCLKMGTMFGLSKEQLDELTMAALIHDIGKMAIPADILTKPTKLSSIEFELVKAHVQAGYDALIGSELSEQIKLAVYQHHERLDGTGYPLGISSDKIGIFAKILAVADTFDAMSSHRPYRPSLGAEAALVELMKYRGKKYDPDIVDICFKIVS